MLIKLLCNIKDATWDRSVIDVIIKDKTSTEAYGACTSNAEGHKPVHGSSKSEFEDFLSRPQAVASVIASLEIPQSS